MPPLTCFRDDQDCHPYERYRVQKPGEQVSKKRSLEPVRLQDTLPISHQSLLSPVLYHITVSFPQTYYFSTQNTALADSNVADVFLTTLLKGTSNKQCVHRVRRPARMFASTYISKDQNTKQGYGFAQPGRGIRPRQRTTSRSMHGQNATTGTSHWAMGILLPPEYAQKAEY